MLKELLPLLKKGDTLGLTIGCEADGPTGPVYRINVMPKLFTLDGEKGDDRKLLNTPLTITGTVEELDSPAFVETLTRFTASATTARQTIDEVEAAHKSAGAPKPTPAKPVASAAHKPGSKPANWKDRVKTALKPAAPDADAAEAAPVAPEPPKNAIEATPSLI